MTTSLDDLAGNCVGGSLSKDEMVAVYEKLAAADHPHTELVRGLIVNYRDPSPQVAEPAVEPVAAPTKKAKKRRS